MLEKRGPSKRQPQLCDVAQHHLVAALRGGHPGVRAHEHARSFGVAPHAVHPRDVGLNDGINVVRGLLQGKLPGLANRLGPTSTTREERDVPQGQPAPCDGDWPAVKQKAERDPLRWTPPTRVRTSGACASCQSARYQGGGPCSGRGYTRSGQYELTKLIALVHLETHCVPKLGGLPPLVDGLGVSPLRKSLDRAVLA